jgi:hypothetical protein
MIGTAVADPAAQKNALAGHLIGLTAVGVVLGNVEDTIVVTA